MPYKIIKVNELDDGAFYFIVQYWNSLSTMRSGGPPDWENDFITDLNRMAGIPLRQLKLSHDHDAKVSNMQRADTLE